VTLPTFLVIGAAKSGTTSLYRYLEQHPDVFMSPVKETLFFAPDCRRPGPDGTARGVATLAEYEALFAAAGACRAIGEASPEYLFSPLAPERIKGLVPDARLIALLRHPAERAYSAYLHLVRDGVEPLTDFRQALAAEPARRAEGRDALWLYTAVSHYHEQLCRYFEHFPREQVQVHLYDDFAADPAAVVHRVFEFIGVDPRFEADTSLRFNPGGIPRSKLVHRAIGTDSRLRRALLNRLPEKFGFSVIVNAINRNLDKPELPAEARAELVASFADEVSRLEQLLGRDLSNWRS
jgi:hypothetical protein